MKVLNFIELVTTCVIVFMTQCCSAFSVVKCCPYGQNLDSNLTECVPLQNKKVTMYSTVFNISSQHMNTNEDVIWLSQVLLNQHMKVKIYNQTLRQNNTIKLRKYNDANRFNILSNGSLQLISPTVFNNSRSFVYNSEEFCMDSFTHENGTREKVILVFPCARVNCVIKCCGKDELLACRGPLCDCEKSNSSNWSLLHPALSHPAEDFTYETIYSYFPDCPEHLVPLAANPWAYPDHIKEKYWNYPNGRIYKENVCSDEIWIKGVVRLGIVRCVTKRPFGSIIDLNYGLHVPEVVLLLLSLLTLIAVPRQRLSVYSYVHDYAMICHAACLLLRGLVWSILIDSHTTLCLYTPMILYFTSVAAALWLNVICINLAYGFWKPLGVQNTRYGAAKMFLWYSVYAWGMTSAMTALTAAMWYAKNVPAYLIRPTLYETRTCFNEEEGEGKVATLAYFYGPIIGLLIINALLFSSTALRVRLLRRNTSILEKKRTAKESSLLHKRRSVVVYVKLLWLMGVLEIALESVAWASDINRYIFAVAASALDVCRAANIFALCCCKKSTVRALRDRMRGCSSPPTKCCGVTLGKSRQKREVAHQGSITSQTSVVSISTDISTSEAVGYANVEIEHI